MAISSAVMAPSVMKGVWFRMPAVEAFPASLSVARLTGLANHLDAGTMERLRAIEDQLHKVPIAPILRARSERGLVRAFERAYKVALDSYIESGIIIWRALGHDYAKLLRLCQSSSQMIDELFFQNADRLDRETFIKAVASLRVLERVGELIVVSEGRAEPERREVPVDYLSQIVFATFITWCLLEYLDHGAKGTPSFSLGYLADGLLAISKIAYEDAVKADMYSSDTERMFWSPSWQQGEVEADLDLKAGRYRVFESVEELLHDLGADKEAQ